MSSLIGDIEGLFNQSNDELFKENANKNANTIPTQRDLLAGVVARHYALEHYLPSTIANAHKSGDIHYHDLDYAPYFPSFNCMLVDLEGMLTKGFTMGNAEIGTPKSIQTACAVTAQIIAQVASHIYGGTTLNKLDEVLAPYVKMSWDKHLKVASKWGVADPEAYADERTTKECYDAFQALEYEINTLHTSNGQTPFVTLGFGLGTTWESRLIQSSILAVRLEGLGRNKRTAIFPKLVYSIRKGINYAEGDPNYDIKHMALKCSAERMYPDIINYDRVVEVTGSFKAPMGCRSFLGTYADAGGPLHGGRNNLGVVSVNLVRIAIEADGDEEAFYHLLEYQLDVANWALETRIERLKGVKAKVAPILYQYGACGVRLDPEDTIDELFKNGRASISLGYIGLHETLIALYGKSIEDDPYLSAKGEQILDRLRRAVDGWKKETGYGFSLYSTPSESLCTRFCELDRKHYGDIPGVTDKGYYTNSFHVDVQREIDPFTKILIEAPYPQIASGGFICYGEFPNMRRNIKALEAVWDFSYDHIPYYGTNTPVDECFQCHYRGEFEATSKGFKCPSCDNRDPDTTSVTRRVCGYLGNPSTRPFNTGKQKEVIRRVKHYG